MWPVGMKLSFREHLNRDCGDIRIIIILFAITDIQELIAVCFLCIGVADSCNHYKLYNYIANRIFIIAIHMQPLLYFFICVSIYLRICIRVFLISGGSTAVFKSYIFGVGF